MASWSRPKCGSSERVIRTSPTRAVGCHDRFETDDPLDLRAHGVGGVVGTRAVGGFGIRNAAAQAVDAATSPATFTGAQAGSRSRPDTGPSTRTRARSRPAAERGRIGLRGHAAQHSGQPLDASRRSLSRNVQLLQLRRRVLRLLDRLNLGGLRYGNRNFLLVRQLGLCEAARFACFHRRHRRRRDPVAPARPGRYLFGSVIAGFGPPTPGIITTNTISRNATTCAAKDTLSAFAHRLFSWVGAGVSPTRKCAFGLAPCCGSGMPMFEVSGSDAVRAIFADPLRIRNLCNSGASLSSCRNGVEARHRRPLVWTLWSASWSHSDGRGRIRSSPDRCADNLSPAS